MAARQTILVVDDVPENIDVLAGVLRENYKVKAATNGERALKIAQSEPVPDLILLDIMMPGMDGYEVCQQLKADERTKNIPILFVTALSDAADEERGLHLGAVDYISKPFSPPIALARIENHLQLKRYQDHLEQLVAERTLELEQTQAATIESMAVLAEYRDPETSGHIKRTQNYVRILAQHLQHNPKYQALLSDDIIGLLYRTVPLHDIGKVGISEHILLKPERLTDQEFAEMKKHAKYGHDSIQAAEKKLGHHLTFLRYGREIAYSHHERWDGSGYPQGLAGEAIPLSGRLMIVADIYDALISKRVYKEPSSHSKAVAFIRDGSGSYFDPDFVDAFLELSEEFRQIALKYADFEEERQALAL